MKNLGFAIQRIEDGVQTPRIWNENRVWELKIEDVRDYPTYLTEPLSNSRALTFMSFDDEGCFITILQPFSGRTNNCITGWIYIPRTLDISCDNILEAYHFAKKVISGEEQVTDEEIEQSFAKEYDSTSYPLPYIASHGTTFAVIYYDGEKEMKDIFGNRYQEYYFDHKAIFLIDKNERIKARDNVIDITGVLKKQYIPLTPPSPTELSSLGDGTNIYVDGEEFSQPIYVAIGDTKNFTFKRKSFEVFQRSVTITNTTQQLLPEKIDWEKKIISALFIIVDERKRPIEDVSQIRMKINGQHFSEGMPILEEKCGDAFIEIDETRDFKKYKGHHNLLNQSVSIHLERKIKEFNKTVKMKNGMTGSMTIASEYLPSTKESPLEGYVVDEEPLGGGKEVLHLSDQFVWKQRLLGFASAIIIGLCIFICVAVVQWFDSHKFQWQFDWPPLVIMSTQTNQTKEDISSDNEKDGTSDKEETFTDEQAVTYMDQNSQWSRDSLEKYALTCGLYDEINEYKFWKIKNRSGKIESSVSFKEIKQFATDSFDDKIVLSGNFSSDGTITIDKWKMKVLEKRNSSIPSSSSVQINVATGTTNSNNDANPQNINDSNNGSETNGGL